MPVADELIQAFKLEGLDRLQAVNTVLKSQDATVAQLQKGMSDMKKTLKDVGTTADFASGEFRDFQNTIKETATNVSNAQRGWVTENGLLKESYFRLGAELRNYEMQGVRQMSFGERFKQHIREERQEHRMMNFTVRESSTAFMVLGGILGGAAGEMSNTTMAVKNGIDAFSGISFSLSTFLGGTGVVVGGVIGAIVALKELFTNTEKVTTAFQSQSDALKEMNSEYDAWTSKMSGAIDARMKVSEIQVNAIRAQIIANQKAMDTISKGPLITTVLWGQSTTQRVKKTKEAIAIIDSTIKANVVALDAYTKATEDGKNADDAKKEAVKALREEIQKLTNQYRSLQGAVYGVEVQPTATRPVSPGYLGMVGAGMEGRALLGMRPPDQLPLIPTIKGAWADPEYMMKDAAVKMDDLSFRAQMFVTSMTAGVGQVANDVTQLWGQAFEDVFGKADNLLTNLLKRMTGTMVQMTIERAAFGLLGLIPGVGQLFGALGMGGPVGGPAGEGEGGEMFSNYGKAATRGGGVAGEIRALRQDLANGTWRVRGNDLALVTERGQIQRRGRTY